MDEGSSRRLPLRLVVVGKSGTGKSTLCNQLAGANNFEVGHGLTSCTTELKELPVNDELVVVDTSDNIQEVVNTQKLLATDRPCKVVIVFCIRCDSRFAVEEYSIYRQLKDRWGDEANFCKRLIVAFTHGDKLDGDPQQVVKEMLEVTWPQLRTVVGDADNRFVVFAKQEQGCADLAAVTKLLDIARELDVNAIEKTSPIHREVCFKASQPISDNSARRKLKIALLFVTAFVVGVVVLTCQVPLRVYNSNPCAIFISMIFMLFLFLLLNSYICFWHSTKMGLIHKRNLGNLIP